MQLLVVHQILVVAATVLAVLFGLRSAILFSSGRAGADLAFMVVSLVIAVCLAAYFRKVRARWAALKAKAGAPRE